MKKILIFNFSEVIGGAEIYFLRLLKNLEGKFEFYGIFSSSVAASLGLKKYFKEIYFVEPGQSLEKWRGLNLFSPYNSFLNSKLNQIFSQLQGKIDIAIFGGAKEVFFLPPLCQKFNKKSIYIHHFAPLPFWLLLPPFKQIFRKRLFQTTQTVHVSRFMDALFKENFGIKGMVIENGIDSKEFKPVNFSERQKIKKDLGLSNRFVIGNVARFHRLKGQAILLRALIPLFQKYSYLTALFVGPGGKKLKVMQGISDRIKVLPFQKDISLYYKAMDVFVLPSLAENFPLTLLEAASSGLACIASSVGGIPEILGKEEGILVPPSDVSSLSRALEELILDEGLRKKLGQTAREKIIKEFDEKTTFNKLSFLLSHL